MATEKDPGDLSLMSVAVAIMSMSTTTQLEDLVSNLEMPGTPGLYELVAPDGTTVRVFDEKVSEEEIKITIRGDISGRLIRDKMKELTLAGYSFAYIAMQTYPEFLRLKKLYRLEKLG